jgi:RNA recognition motif-containing protein
MLLQAMKPSKMLKLSKDGIKVKRRIPFRKAEIDQKAIDKCMVYVENFPDTIDHEQLARIFKRAGKVRHISVPKYKESKKPKGFAFIEFISE